MRVTMPMVTSYSTGGTASESGDGDADNFVFAPADPKGSDETVAVNKTETETVPQETLTINYEHIDHTHSDADTGSYADDFLF